jgi:hypothetical protein
MPGGWEVRGECASRRRLFFEEGDQAGEIMRLIVPHAAVAAVGAEQKRAVRKLGRNQFHVFWIHRAVGSPDDQRPGFDAG